MNRLEIEAWQRGIAARLDGRPRAAPIGDKEESWLAGWDYAAIRCAQIGGEARIEGLPRLAPANWSKADRASWCEGWDCVNAWPAHVIALCAAGRRRGWRVFS